VGHWLFLCISALGGGVRQPRGSGAASCGVRGCGELATGTMAVSKNGFLGDPVAGASKPGNDKAGRWGVALKMETPPAC
jgi:hypothetical protein